MNQNNRVHKRLPFQNEYILVAQFGLVETQIVDVSKMGLGVKADSTLPLKFKNGCKLTVFFLGMELPQAKLIWAKKDFNNMTRLGLKLSTSIID